MDLGDAVDAILVGPAALRADIAGAAVALGCAADAIGGPDALPRSGPAILVITVPSANWVGPVAEVARASLPRSGSKGIRGRGGRNRAEGAVLVVEGDGTTATRAPGRSDEELAEALHLARIVVGISQDPGRLLPANLMRAADLSISVGPLDAAGIGTVVEAVTGVAPIARLPDGLAAQCDPDDLALAVHAARGADPSIAHLAAILARKASAASDGPRLEDLHGLGAAREWGLALVDDLRAWRDGGPGAPRWSDLESSILLSGPPGVGKTIFAAALARSAGLPFLAGSLGQWQSARDGHLGHTLGAMRTFFERARRSPCVVLIDEMDSFGDRTLFPENHRNYSVQIVNALLEHLDGSVSREGVVVVGATNDPDRIDPAIRRSGRLDRHVRIGIPDAGDIARILRHHLGDDLPDASLGPLAARLVGMSGADVAALVRRARGIARRTGRSLTVGDLDAAADEARPSLPDHARGRVAVHEAGHVLAAASAGHAGPMAASIDADGGTAWISFGERLGLANEESLDGCLTIMLAGRAAEEVVLGDVTAGSAEDLAAATRLAVLMETRLGFSRATPLLAFGGDGAPDLARLPWAAGAVHRRLSIAYEVALDLMRVHRVALERLSEALRGKGHLGDAEIRGLLAAPRKRKERAKRPHRPLSYPDRPGPARRVP
ncbi:AAA family ATPase [Methylobacterium oryzae]